MTGTTPFGTNTGAPTIKEFARYASGQALSWSAMTACGCPITQLIQITITSTNITMDYISTSKDVIFSHRTLSTMLPLNRAQLLPYLRFCDITALYSIDYCTAHSLILIDYSGKIHLETDIKYYIFCSDINESILTSGRVVYFAFISKWILYNENVWMLLIVIFFVPNGLIIGYQHTYVICIYALT